MLTIPAARPGSIPSQNGKLITNHTDRKTFITNSIVLGMNTKTIKDITSHKKDSVFNKYVKISEEYKKLEMNRTWDNIIIQPKE